MAWGCTHGEERNGEVDAARAAAAGEGTHHEQARRRRRRRSVGPCGCPRGPAAAAAAAAAAEGQPGKPQEAERGPERRRRLGLEGRTLARRARRPLQGARDHVERVAVLELVGIQAVAVG